MIKEIKTDLFADYFQFYIQDEDAEGIIGDSWRDEAVDRLLALAPGTIGVGTVRNMTVPVTIKIFDSEPEIPADNGHIAQINECDLETNAGRLVVAGCIDYFPDALRMDIPPGIYRARIYDKESASSCFFDLCTLYTNLLHRFHSSVLAHIAVPLKNGSPGGLVNVYTSSQIS